MFQLTKYLERKAAAEELTAQGVRTTAQGLADMAHRGKGPRYAIINGRALYTREWLLDWIERQAERPVRKPSTARQEGAATS